MNPEQQPITILLTLLLAVFLWIAVSSTAADTFVHPLTGQMDSVALSKERQIQMGREMAPEFERQLGGLFRDPYAQARLRQVGMTILQALQRIELQKREQTGLALNWSDFPFQFNILNSSTINAYALPGGLIYITRGLLRNLDNDQLAAVLSHEISHVVLRHAAKAFEARFKGNLILWVIQTIFGEQPREVYNVAEGINYILQLSYSREQEREADHLGYILSCLAGYDPRAMLEVFAFLKEIESSADPEFLRTHPLPQSRIEYAKRLTCAFPAW